LAQAKTFEEIYDGLLINVEWKALELNAASHIFFINPIPTINILTVQFIKNLILLNLNLKNFDVAIAQHFVLLLCNNLL